MRSRFEPFPLAIAGADMARCTYWVGLGTGTMGGVCGVRATYTLVMDLESEPADSMAVTLCSAHAVLKREELKDDGS